MGIIPFIKMHGLGNNFVIIEQNFIDHNINLSNLALSISNRTIGIGCDQLIIFDKQETCILMLIYNQDGSSAEACGNASRCISRLMFDKYKVRDILIKVKEREVSCHYTSKDNIVVNMGRASFNNKWMPSNEKLWNFVQLYGVEPKESICVDVANPHLVIFSQNIIHNQQIIVENLQNSDLFPIGININFATIKNNSIFLSVWERGVGLTLACGSGACATFAAAKKLGFVENNAIVEFSLGNLKMKYLDKNILMQGPANYVFSGEYYV